MWKLLAVIAPAVPLFSWYLIMLKKDGREYPRWLKKVFSNTKIETLVLSIAGVIVLWMVIGFQFTDTL